jgi:hypothetical protein
VDIIIVTVIYLKLKVLPGCQFLALLLRMPLAKDAFITLPFAPLRVLWYMESTGIYSSGNTVYEMGVPDLVTCKRN